MKLHSHTRIIHSQPGITVVDNENRGPVLLQESGGWLSLHKFIYTHDCNYHTEDFTLSPSVKRIVMSYYGAAKEALLVGGWNPEAVLQNVLEGLQALRLRNLAVDRIIIPPRLMTRLTDEVSGRPLCFTNETLLPPRVFGLEVKISHPWACDIVLAQGFTNVGVIERAIEGW